MNLKQLITIWTHDLLEWLTSKFDSITRNTSVLAKQSTLEVVGRDAEAAKIAAQSIVIPTDYAKEASVRSGNVTAISQITNSNYGLSALKSYLVNTIYYYLVNNIYSYLTNTLYSAIASLPTVAQIQSGLTTEQNATENKNEILNELSAVKTALQGSNSSATNTALEILLQSIITTMYKGVPIVSQSGDATISPNTWNIWQSVATNLTITKGNDISGIVNEYIIRLTLGSSWVEGTNTITFNGFTLEWNGGSAPTWTAGHIYEISIVDNIALWADITPAS